MGWVECKSVGFLGPDFTDVLVGRETSESLESSGEVISCDEVGQVCFKLMVRVIEVTFDRCVLDGAVHPLDLAVGPGMIGFGEPVFDAVAVTDSVEGMSTEASRWPLTVPWQIRELDSVVGEHRMDAVGTASISLSRKSTAARMSAFSTSSTMTYFEVRSMATKRYSLPSAVRTSARSMWKKPMG